MVLPPSTIRSPLIRTWRGMFWLLWAGSLMLALPGFGGLGRLTLAQEGPLPSEAEEASALDAALVSPQPSATEVKIERALAEPVSFTFQDAPLEQVVAFLREHTGENVVVERNALQEEGVTEDTPVTLALSGVPLHSALSLLLEQLNLTFLVQNDVLLITSKTKAQEKLSTRVYPVGDLCREEDGYRELIDLITSTIAPDSWSDGGGTGTIAPHRSSAQLVISQTYANQRQVQDLLRNLRAGGGAVQAGREESRLRARLRRQERRIEQLRAELARVRESVEARGAVLSKKVNSLQDEFQLAKKLLERPKPAEELREKLEREKMKPKPRRR